MASNRFHIIRRLPPLNSYGLTFFSCQTCWLRKVCCCWSWFCSLTKHFFLILTLFALFLFFLDSVLLVLLFFPYLIYVFNYFLGLVTQNHSFFVEKVKIHLQFFPPYLSVIFVEHQVASHIFLNHCRIIVLMLSNSFWQQTPCMPCFPLPLDPSC